MISAHKCFNLLVHNVFWAMREELKEDRFEGGLTEEEKHWRPEAAGIFGPRSAPRPSGTGQDHAGGHHRSGDGGQHPHHLRL